MSKKNKSHEKNNINNTQDKVKSVEGVVGSNTTEYNVDYDIGKVTIPCINNGVSSTIEISIGHPAEDNNPIQHQAKILAEQQGIIIRKDTLESLDRLYKLANENGVSFIELVKYAISDANSCGDKSEKDINKSSA